MLERWPLDPGWRVRALPVAELVRRLLPTARQGLQQAGVAGEPVHTWPVEGPG